MLSKSSLVILSGGCFCLSYIIFVDGFIIAKRCELPYNFVMWIPQLLSVLGLFLTFFINPLAIMPIDRDEVNESEEMNAKTLFFFSVLTNFAAIALAVYIWIQPYSTHNKSWPGVALLLQCLLLILCTYLLLASRAHGNDDNEDNNFVTDNYN